jgi:hypothetical protein
MTQPSTPTGPRGEAGPWPAVRAGRPQRGPYVSAPTQLPGPPPQRLGVRPRHPLADRPRRPRLGLCRARRGGGLGRDRRLRAPRPRLRSGGPDLHRAAGDRRAARHSHRVARRGELDGVAVPGCRPVRSGHASAIPGLACLLLAAPRRRLGSPVPERARSGAPFRGCARDGHPQRLVGLLGRCFTPVPDRPAAGRPGRRRLGRDHRSPGLTGRSSAPGGGRRAGVGAWWHGSPARWTAGLRATRRRRRPAAAPAGTPAP